MCSLRLETERLLLRPHEAADIPHFVPLLSDFAVSKNLSRVPHPYTEDDGQSFVNIVADGLARGDAFAFLIVLKASRQVLGGCGVHLEEDGLFEIGYWLGMPYWGKGYASEAAGALAGFAFDTLKVATLKASYFHDNPASGRVLAKVGFKPAGVEQRNCLSRGHAVYCRKVMLDREDFGRRP